MVTKSRSGASYNRLLCEFAGLSTDIKPIEKFSDTSGDIYIENGSEFIEMDTSKKSLYNAENKQWEEV